MKGRLRELVRAIAHLVDEEAVDPRGHGEHGGLERFTVAVQQLPPRVLNVVHPSLR